MCVCAHKHNTRNHATLANGTVGPHFLYQTFRVNYEYMHKSYTRLTRAEQPLQNRAQTHARTPMHNSYISQLPAKYFPISFFHCVSTSTCCVCVCFCLTWISARPFDSWTRKALFIPCVHIHKIPHIFAAEPIHWQFSFCLAARHGYVCAFVCVLTCRAQTILFDAFHGDGNIEMIECNFRLISGKMFVSKRNEGPLIRSTRAQGNHTIAYWCNDSEQRK